MAARPTSPPGQVTARTGDTFDELFLRERQPMVRVAYLIAGSTAVAEEVTHDALVTVFERWDRLDQPGAYLRRCVVNGAMRASRRRAHGERLAAVEAPPDEIRPAFDHTLDAARRLAARPRALIVLRYYARLTSTTTTTATPEGSGPPVSETLVLRPGGIGPFDFGAPEDEVVAAVTAELGEPRGNFQGGGNRGCEPVAEDVPGSAWS